MNEGFHKDKWRNLLRVTKHGNKLHGILVTYCYFDIHTLMHMILSSVCNLTLS